MKYMQAEDAERNPSDCTSREIAAKVNNELQPQHYPPLPRYYCYYYSCFFQSFSKHALNYQGSRLISHCPALIHKAPRTAVLICNRLGAGLTLWAERRQERGGEPGGHQGPASLILPLPDRREGRAARLPLGTLLQPASISLFSSFFFFSSPSPPPLRLPSERDTVC